MQSKAALTKKDFVAVLGSAIFLLANLAATGSGGRERAKRTVCLANLKHLTLAWHLYADDNDDRIVNGDTEEYPALHEGQCPWVRRDWQPGMTVQSKKRAIENGALFPYTREFNLYRCPTGARQETRSYTIVDAMNCQGWESMGGVMISKRAQISKPTQRFVFLDHGGSEQALLGGWTCYVNEYRWWDPPAIRHDYGTTFSFADGHCECWKWQDKRTIEFGRNARPFSAPQPGNEDIRRTQLAAWGSAAIRGN